MKTKKIPLRKCVSCQERKPKKELIRVIRDKDGNVSLDVTGKANGRGAYVCLSLECFEKAKKTRRFDSALETSIPEEVYDKLIEEIKKHESNK